jgi:hypothetical protein
MQWHSLQWLTETVRIAEFCHGMSSLIALLHDVIWTGKETDNISMYLAVLIDIQRANVRWPLQPTATCFTHTENNFVTLCLFGCARGFVSWDFVNYLHAYLLTYILAYLLTYLFIYLLTYLLTYLHKYLLIYLLTYLLNYCTYLLILLLTYLFIYLFTYLFSYLLTYLLIYLLTYLLTYLHTYLFIYLLTYLITPWSTALLEKLTGLYQSRNSPHFIDPEISLPHSQLPATCLYPEPVKSNP